MVMDATECWQSIKKAFQELLETIIILYYSQEIPNFPSTVQYIDN